MTIKRVMARIVRARGVNVLDRIMAVKILTDGGRACGALGWNVSTGEYVIVRAKTVVSAQGRSATRGFNNSTHNPYNVWMYPYNTGAGVVLGYDVGAAVTELDTYQRAGDQCGHFRPHHHAAQGLRLSRHERHQQFRRA